MEVNESLPVRQVRGHPAGTRGRREKYNGSTQRDSSAFEHVLLQTEAVRNPDVSSIVQECGRGRFKGQKNISNSQISEQTPPYRN